jgi:pre-rRNA-processing protein IPI3
MSLASTAPPEATRNLSNHRAAVTSLVMGHSSSSANICISASKDNTCIVWNYITGELLRTFLLPTTPISLALDPCDRGFYVGFLDGSIRLIDLFQPSSSTNSLYDPNLQATPVQVTSDPLSGAPSEAGATFCLGLSYDGTILLSGHENGKILQWDAGPRKFSSEVADLNAPVNNLKMLSPFQDSYAAKAVMVVKPKLGEGNHAFTGQFTQSLASGRLTEIIQTVGFPADVLETAIMEFSAPVSSTSSAGDAKLRKENEDLWAIVNEQRALQKRTYDKYREAATE